MEATEHDSPKLTMKQNQSKPTLSIAYPTAIAVCLLILRGASAQADEDIESFSRLSDAPWEEVLALFLQLIELHRKSSRSE